MLLVDAESGMLISPVGSKVNPEMIGAGMSAFGVTGQNVWIES